MRGKKLVAFAEKSTATEIENNLMATLNTIVKNAIRKAEAELAFTAAMNLKAVSEKMKLSSYGVNKDEDGEDDLDLSGMTQVQFTFKKNANADLQSFVLGFARKMGHQVSITADRQVSVFAFEKIAADKVLAKNGAFVDVTIEKLVPKK